MSDAPCRWGILGSSGIARKNWQSIKNSGNGRLVAVASRDTARAEKWIAECQAHVPFDPRPEAVGGYENLLARKDIDAVYIPLPTGIRKEWAIKAAEAGKHVLAEKPCGIDVAGIEEMVAACKKANVQFMDGVMFMHSTRLGALRSVIDDGKSIGRLRRITTQFMFNAPEDFLTGNIRMNSSLEPLGCMGDLGWYNIRFTLWVMNEQLPKQVTGRILQAASRSDSPGKVPMEFSGEMFFDDDVSAGFYCSFMTGHQQLASINGTEGFVQLEDFVLGHYGNRMAFTIGKANFEQTVCDFHMENRSRQVIVDEFSDSHATSQETRLFRNFGALALGGKPDPIWPERALKTQKVMMACLESAKNDSAPVAL